MTNFGVLSFYISKSHPDYSVVKKQASEGRRLYNTLNKLKQEKSELHKNKNIQTPVANSLRVDLSKNYCECWRKIIENKLSITLPQKVAQHIGRQCDEAWRSIIQKRVKGEKAGYPSYKNKYSELRYTKQAISQKRGMNRVIPTGWKQGCRLPDFVALKNVQSALLKPTPDGFELKVLYKKHIDKPLMTGHNLAAIDIGLNNLATIITTDGSRPKIVQGKPLKSLNQYYNKKAAKGGEKKTRDRLWFKRSKQINHYLNVASNEIVKYLQQKDVQSLVIGWNMGMKTRINIGKRNNQNFVYIPHVRLISMLKHKCEREGIEVIIQEESYTSKASFIDGDNIPTYEQGRRHSFSGRRVKRGVYVSKTGIRIHADVNAAWNILRKCNPSIGWTNREVAFPENLKLTL